MQQEEITDNMAWLENARRRSEMDEATMRQSQGIVSQFSGSENPNLIQYQLDLSEEKEIIDHLLRGHVRKNDKAGNTEWHEPTDPASKSLTDYGVEKLMNIINFYLSRNIILSSYDAETINGKMKDLGWELADAIFLEYEHIFYRPSYDALLKRDKPKLDKIFSNKLSNREEIVKEISLIISDYSNEAENIYKKNCKQYPLICRMIVDAIHSAYNRALGGEERSSLRKVMSVNQTQMDNFAPSQASQPKRRSSWSPLSLIKG